MREQCKRGGEPLPPPACHACLLAFHVTPACHSYEACCHKSAKAMPRPFLPACLFILFTIYVKEAGMDGGMVKQHCHVSIGVGEVPCRR